MIRRVFPRVASVGLFALLAFACSETPPHDPNGFQSTMAKARETGPPILANDEPVIAFSRAQYLAFASNSCSDSIANCADPVKYLGMQKECACFACGYGTAGQRTVCTKNPDDRKALLKRSK